METGLRPGYLGTVRRKGRQQTNPAYCYRATSPLYLSKSLRPAPAATYNSLRLTVMSTASPSSGPSPHWAGLISSTANSIT